MESTGNPPPALTTTEEEEEEEEDGNASTFVSNNNPRSTPSPLTKIDSLPDELLSEILLCNSAEDIHQSARFVCKRWRRTIHRRGFIAAHFQRSGYGLLMRNELKEHCATFIAATQGGGIGVSELSCKLGSDIEASCNGLILASYSPKESFENVNHALFIENPATKWCLHLPLLSSKRWLAYFGLAYAPASEVYKVVASCMPLDKFSMPLDKFSILTVGVDNAWRHVATQQLSPEANNLFYDDPLIAEGFMHWASSFDDVVLTLNVETEVFAELRTPLSPRAYHIRRRKHQFLSTGRHLSVLIFCGDFSWQVWEMKGGSGEWTKVLPDIDLKARKSEIQQQLALKDDVILIPVGWVKYPELLLFFPDDTSYNYKKKESSCIVYNLDRDEIKSINLPASIHCCEAPLVHEKSLVCLS